MIGFRGRGIAVFSIATATFACGAGGCRERRAASQDLGGVSPVVSAPAPERTTKESNEDPARKRGEAVVLDAIADVHRCVVDHRGPVLDMGSGFVNGLLGSYALAPAAGLTEVEHDGATFAKVESREVTFRFVLEQKSPLAIAARVRGGAAKSAAVWLDGKPMGALPFGRGALRTVSTRPTAAAVAAGSHVVTLRFGAAARGSAEPLAEIDWIRVASSEEEGATYAAPTERELVGEARLSGEPHRALALRAPGVVRCPVGHTRHAHLQAALGLAGPGDAVAELRIVRESAGGARPTAVRTVSIHGGEGARWSAVDWPLEEPDADDDAPASLELAAISAPPGARILFGDPKLVAPVQPARPTPAARIVVALVLAGIEPSRFPPRIEEGLAPNLSEVLKSSVEFVHHRAPTTVSSGVLASILTGLPPRLHLVEDGGARLSDDLTTIGSAARDGSVQTAMFTGSPATFAAFGFARGWDKFASYSPVSGAPAVAPIADASKWLVEHVKGAGDRALVLIHARGGHPPWDVTPAEAAKLPPFDYSGPMEPRRSAELLAKARNPGGHFRLGDGDRTRMWATYEAAMGGNDRAIGALVESLKKHDLWQDTMLIVTGDVGVDAANKAPFGDGEDLSEASLSTPLWIKFPKKELAGLRVQAPTGAMDIGKTILGAFGLEPPREFGGNDLFQLATGAVLADLMPSVATLDLRYATRWGDRVLAGSAGKAPTLCVLAKDLSCDHDASEELPFAAQSLFRFTYDAITQASKHPLHRAHGREPATLDADTAAALTVWGQVETRFTP